MKRGVIEFTKAEVLALYNRIDFGKFSKSPLKEKFTAGVNSESPNVQIEVSEEELEFVMDEIIIPDPTLDTPELLNAKEKIRAQIEKFRGGGVQVL